MVIAVSLEAKDVMRALPVMKYVHLRDPMMSFKLIPIDLVHSLGFGGGASAILCSTVNRIQQARGIGMHTPHPTNFNSNLSCTDTP